MTAAQLLAFFTAYCEAFNASDGDAVAELWHTPSSITDSRDGLARVTCWSDEAAMRANMVALCTMYRGAGAHAWSFELIDDVPLGANHAFANIRWTMTRAGATVQRFATGYQLGRFDRGWRVVFCTAYQEDLSETRSHVAA